MLLALVVTAACGGGGGDETDQASQTGCDATDVPAHEDSGVVIEGGPSPIYAPFRDPSLLEGTSYTAVYVEQPCEDHRAADLSSGQADIALTSLDQYLVHQPDATVVGVVDQSAGADALVLDTVRYRYLHAVDDLSRLLDERGDDPPVLAYTPGTPGELLLNHLASTNQALRLTNYELVEVGDSAAAYAMLEAGEAQLAMLSEPDASTARAAGFNAAATSGDAPDLLIDVVLASDEVLARDPAAVRAVLDAFYTRVDDYLANRRSFVQLVSEDAGWTETQADAVVDRIRLYGTNDANTFLNEREFPVDRPQASQTIEAIGSLLAVMHPDLEMDVGAVDGSFVADLVEARYGSGVGSGE